MPFNNYVNLGSNSSRTWNLRNAGTKEKHSVFVWLEISMKRSLVWYFTATNRLPRKSYTILVFIESMIKCLKKNIKRFLWGNCFEITSSAYLAYLFMISNSDDFARKIWNTFIVILFYSRDETVKALISSSGHKIWKQVFCNTKEGLVNRANKRRKKILRKRLQ